MKLACGVGLWLILLLAAVFLLRWRLPSVVMIFGALLGLLLLITVH